jgi:hypothetical protein
MDKDTLPTYELVLNKSEHGTQFISLVDEPAIQLNWFAFNKHFSLAEITEQKKIAGAFLIPEQKIYRKDENGEYYIKFSKETIQEIADKFNSEQRGRSINLMHQDGSTLSVAFVSENWVTALENDKSKNFGFDLPEGTWFGVVKIEDEDFWQSEIKTQKLRGFSIEGFFDMKKLKMSNNMEYGKFKLEKEATLEDGTVIYTTASDFEVGAPVFMVDENGQQFAAKDGDYMLTGFGLITVKDGLITEAVKEEVVEVEPTPEAEVEVESTKVVEPNAPIKAEVTPMDLESIKAMLQPVVDELNARVSALEQRFNEIEAGTGQAINELKEEKETLRTELSAMKDSIPTNSISKPETNRVRLSTEPPVKLTSDELLQKVIALSKINEKAI